MASHRPRNDRAKAGHRATTGAAGAPRGGQTAAPALAWTPASDAEPGRPRRKARAGHGGGGKGEWLWGWHAVAAALANPARPPGQRLLATADRARAIEARFGRALTLDVVENGVLARTLPAGAVHQGVGLRADPIEAVSLAELAEPPAGLLLMLDHVTDPQNVGSIFRAAAAFGARGVILQDRHAPVLTGALAKAAAGAVDALPHARETNLSRALERLDAAGWRAVGLDGAAAETLTEVLAEAPPDAPTVLVLGSEGEGLRRLIREHCHALARIPMPGGAESLNVSQAAAVALHEAARYRGRPR